MHRLAKAYIGGMAVNGCVVRGVREYLLRWLGSLGFKTSEGAVELPKAYCRYAPASLLEHVYFIKGAFEAHGEFFMGDPHGREVLVIFKTGSRKVAKSLRLLGLSPLETTDEAGVRRFIVLYERRDVKRFVRLVKPVIENVHVAEALGLCGRRML
ncbi:MAG: hypothetical protein ACP5J0_01670 [Pyrobaculum sp.]|jgi:hypothetical protein